MMLLNPAIVQSAPEITCLEILVRVLDATLVALVACHPCLETDDPCTCPLAPCTCADALYNVLHELENAIIDYRAHVEDALDAEYAGEDYF